MGEMKSFLNSLCVDHGLKTHFETQNIATTKPVSTVGTKQEGDKTSGGRIWPEHWQDKNHEVDGGEGHEDLRHEVSKLEVQGHMMRASDDVSGAELDPELVTGQAAGDGILPKDGSI